MFVSSYNTYISTSSANRTTRERDESASHKSFKQSLVTSTTLPNSKFIQNAPVNYLSHNKILSTKERIYDQLRQNTYQSNINKFAATNSKVNAPSTYATNSVMFSLVIKHPTTPKQVDNNPLKEVQKHITRDKMINTYISNDKYYQITA